MTFSQGAMATLGEGAIRHSRRCNHVLLQQTQLFQTQTWEKKKREERWLTTARVYFCEQENDSHRYMAESSGGAGKRNICILSPDPETPAEF